MIAGFLWSELFTVSNLGATNRDPDISAFADGRFVIVWEQQDTDIVYSKVISSDATSIGSARVIATSPTNTSNLAYPVVTVDSTGGYFVSWLDYGSVSGVNRFRSFDENGLASVPATATAQADGTNATNPIRNSLIALPDGDVVLIYENSSLLQGGSSGQIIFNPIEADGSPLAPRAISTSGGITKLVPNAAAQPNGDFVVSWTGYTALNDYATEIYASLVSANGTISAPIQVNTTTTGGQANSTVAALSDGRYVVIWEDFANRPAITPILRGQILSESGALSGSQFIVGGGVQGLEEPTVVGLLDGGFMVIWEDANLMNATAAIRAQVFTSAGLEASDVMDIADDSEANIFSDAVRLADGRVAVTWSVGEELGTSTQSIDVVARIVDPRLSGVTLGGTDVADNFFGSRFDDVIAGGLGNDTLSGAEGDDDISGGRGHDTIDGGTDQSGLDIDRLIVTGAVQNYRLSQVSEDFVLRDLRSGVESDGTDTFRNIEAIVFDGAQRSVADLIAGSPFAANDAFSFSEDFTEGGLPMLSGNLFADNGAGLDGDPDTDPLTVTKLNGSTVTPAPVTNLVTLTLGSGATIEIDATTGDFEFLFGDAYDYLPEGVSTTASFTYTVYDGIVGEATATATFTITGIDSNDTFTGTNGVDVISAGVGNDLVRSLAGNDALFGGSGTDTLVGGIGRDTLNGGTERDIFDLNSVAESRGALRDRITDFQRRIDDIDVSTIDANTRAGGNQAFAFIGTREFTDTAGQLRIDKVGASWRVEGDINGDGRADFAIDVVGAAALTKGDFIL